MKKFFDKYTRGISSQEIYFYANTIGEIEAMIAVASASKDVNKVIIYLPEGMIPHKELLESIKLYKKLANVHVDVILQSFKKSVFGILLNAITSKTMVCSMNFFDLRHSYIFRRFIHLIMDYMVRDSVFPHDSKVCNRKSQFSLPLLTEKEAYNDAYAGLLVKVLGESRYVCNLKSYLSNTLDSNVDVTKRVLIISKNVPKNHLAQKEKYIKNIISKFGDDTGIEIYVKPHPREDSINLNLINKYSLKTDEPNTMYEQISRSKLVFVFGGSTGWLLKFTSKLIYIDDLIFNRGMYKSGIRFHGENIARSPNDLANMLKKIDQN